MNNPHQRTKEWFKEREGKLTASMFAQAAGLGPGSRQQAWRRLFNIEVFTGNEATQWGEDHESDALAAYHALHMEAGTSPDLVGFMVHPDLPWLGCSPDLLVGDKGLGEIKCPFSQELYLEIPPHYMAQVQGQLQVTKREWCDFICWTPERMSVQRIQRSDEYWDWLHLQLADFWSWVVAEIEPPRSKKPKAPAVSITVSEPIIYYTLKGN